MPRKQSAGTLLYRQGASGLEVLIVHPSGPYNRRAPWSVPKGIPDEGETDLEQTARREAQEEVGITAGDLVSLGFIEYKKSYKDVHCFAGPALTDAEPLPTSWEIDRGRFRLRGRGTALYASRSVPFLDRLLAHLDADSKKIRSAGE